MQHPPFVTQIHPFHYNKCIFCVVCFLFVLFYSAMPMEKNIPIDILIIPSQIPLLSAGAIWHFFFFTFYRHINHTVMHNIGKWFANFCCLPYYNIMVWRSTKLISCFILLLDDWWSATSFCVTECFHPKTENQCQIQIIDSIGTVNLVFSPLLNCFSLNVRWHHVSCKI